jgi:hypothetical protein
MDHTVQSGFVSPPQRVLLQVDSHAEALLERLVQLAALASAPDDYQRI